ncbi:MAG TPA: DUF2293 domain-containing protein [Verrucomicrobiae bacterium]|nr:DUF2293 domain-containing protein [Verrucomicrobiae bacterium]
MSETKQPRRETGGAPPLESKDIVVFMLRRETKCAECGCALFDGNLLRMENNRPLCLDCADLGHLEFLGAGNTALTRRATKHSPLRAVVVRWARARNRYERQGILVTPDAIERAEEECLADEERRARQRERAAERRELEDQQYETAVAERLRGMFPGCPADEAARIAAWTCRKHSGRVGRSAAAKEFDPQALRLAMVAHIRHEHTKYDELLMKYGDRQLARAEVREKIEAILARWEQSRI